MSFEEAIALREAGKYQNALQLLECLWEAIDSNQRAEQIVCLNEQSECLWRLGRLTKAEIQAQEALKLAEQRPHNLQGQGTALNNLGMTKVYLGDLQQAEAALQRSLAIFEGLNDQTKVARAFNSLGVVYSTLGELDRAEGVWKRALVLYDQVEEPQEIAKCLNNLGEIFRIRGELGQAEDFYQRSLTIFEQLSNMQNVALAIHNLGLVYWQQGKLDRAEQFFREVLLMTEKTNNPLELADIRFELARVLLSRKGGLKEAAEQIHQIKHLTEIASVPDVTVRCHLATGWFHFKQSKLSEALADASTAREQAAAVPLFDLQIDATYLLIQILLEQYTVTKQPEQRTRIDDLLKELNYVSRRQRLHQTFVETTLVQGLLKRVMFDLEGAEEQFQLAELLAEERGITPVADRARLEISFLREHMSRYEKLVFERPEEYEQEQLQRVKLYLKQAKHFV
ncbi:MAG: tetratricopeptide repeat protein [Candidatus Hodarchaeales archaeon]|jgi:tetratricopeptide (TPR) repeat protein